MWGFKVGRATSTVPPPQYPQGHAGHLTPGQDEALEQFKELVEEQGLWKRGPSVAQDDATLLRYLRARRWVPRDAYHQFRGTQEWRSCVDLDDFYRTIDLDLWARTTWPFPHWTGRRDRDGRPVFLCDIGLVDWNCYDECERLVNEFDMMGSRSASSASSPLLAYYGTRFDYILLQAITPLCTHAVDRSHPDVPVTMSTFIIDVSDLTFRKFWAMKSHLQVLFGLLCSHYPETFARIFMVGASSTFSLIWNYVKRWLDPVSIAKIALLRPAEVEAALEAAIDVRNIPVKYGGELDYSHGQPPCLDPAIESTLDWEPGHDGMPVAPLVWEDTDDGEHVACFACGSKDGEPQRQLVCTMRKRRPDDEEDTLASAAVASPTAGDKLALAGEQLQERGLSGHLSAK